MKARRIVITSVILIVAFLGIGYRVVRSSAADEVKAVTVLRGDISATISASGKVVLLNEVKLNFKTAGKLKNLYVEEGDRVEEGQILAELDDSDLCPQLKQAEASLSTARANWSKLKAGTSDEELALAQVTVDNAAVALEAAKRKLAEVEASTTQDVAVAQTAVDNSQATRNWALAEREEALKDWQDKVKEYEHPVLHIPNYTSGQEAEVNTAKDKADTAYNTFLTAEEAYKTALENYEAASLKAKSAVKAAQDQRDVANGQYQTALAQLNIKKAPVRSQDARVAKNQIRIAQATLEQMENKINDAVLRAPFSGKVVAISVKEGEFVSGGGGMELRQSGAGSAFIVLADSDHIQLIADVDESDIGKVKIGQPAEIMLDAYPGRVIRGKVSEVAVGPSQSAEGAVVFPVKVDPSQTEALLLKAMAGDVKIVVGGRRDAIIVPASAVVEKNGKRVVFVVEGSTAIIRQVRLGLSAENYFEVEDGLEAGEKIAVEGASGLRDGARVRTK